MFFLVAVVFFITSCNSNEFTQLHEKRDLIPVDSIPFNDSCCELDQEFFQKYDSVMLENSLYKIEQSSKVQRLFNQVKLDSNRGGNILLSKGENENEISVKIQEDNGMSYVSHFTFIILPEEGYKIYYYDPLHNIRLTLAEWDSN
ncbi:hypothetical protein [Putridiphycobacter roseus]|nr:hypothetical protein [Putridiphycobacter roseus]